LVSRHVAISAALDAAALAEEVTALEAAEAAIVRIDSINREINALVERDYDAARGLHTHKLLKTLESQDSHPLGLARFVANVYSEFS